MIINHNKKRLGKKPNVIKLTNLSHFVVGYFLCYTKNKRGKVMLNQIKAHLLDSINDIVSTANQFVLHPEKDFSRQSQLMMKTMIQAILTMGGNTFDRFRTPAST